MTGFALGFLAVTRWVLPALSVAFLVFCCIPLLRRSDRIVAYILTDDGVQLPLPQVENMVGQDPSNDAVLQEAADRHAVITVSGSRVMIRPLKGHRVYVNKKPVKSDTIITPYDVVSLGGRELTVRRKRLPGKKPLSASAYALATATLLVFEGLLAVELGLWHGVAVALVYGVFVVAQSVWIRLSRNHVKAVLLPVFYLCSLGFTVTAGSGMGALLKQSVCLIVGFTAAALIGLVMKRPKLAGSLKVPAVVASAALFGANLLFGVVYNGSQNWVEVGGFSFQPSELIKVIFIFLSAAGIETVVRTKNTVGYALFTLACMGVLAYLRDFGTAAVYGGTCLAVLLLRKCPVKVLACLTGGTVLCGGLAAWLIPYVGKRLLSFGHAWANASTTGYQQTRTMVALASGGFSGVGGGKGYLRQVAANDTDLVFGLIGEEYGVIIAFCAALCFAYLTVYCLGRLRRVSLFYAIPAVAASVLLLLQASLNVFGSLDLLPFTGVTLPFVSNGGSSLLTSAALTAFLGGGGDA